METKEITNKVRFVVVAGQASANQTLSQLFAKLAINLSNFCEEFNEKTAGLELEEDQDLLLTVELKVYSDKSFDYEILKPSASFLILLVAEYTQVSKSKMGNLNLDDLLVIAMFKFGEVNLQSSCTSILGTAKALGVSLS